MEHIDVLIMRFMAIPFLLAYVGLPLRWAYKMAIERNRNLSVVMVWVALSTLSPIPFVNFLLVFLLWSFMGRK